MLLHIILSIVDDQNEAYMYIVSTHTCSVYCSFSKSSALTLSLFPSTSSTSDCNLYTGKVTEYHRYHHHWEQEALTFQGCVD